MRNDVFEPYDEARKRTTRQPRAIEGHLVSVCLFFCVLLII
ncbi:MAG: hypothetical protein AAFR52_10280 [Pseudomonadota bacterium]